MSAKSNKVAKAKWARRAVWGLFVVVMCIGCNPLSTLAFITRDTPKIPAEAPLPPHKDQNTGETKPDVKVVVMCAMPNSASLEFAGADRELTNLISKKLPEAFVANESKVKVKIVPASQVEKYKSSHPEWKTMSPATLGRQLGADYVLDIAVSGLQIYEPGTGKQLYQGRANVSVDVYDATNKKSTDKSSGYVHAFRFPHTSVMDATSVPLDKFKLDFMQNLATELALKHIEHKASETIAGGDFR